MRVILIAIIIVAIAAALFFFRDRLPFLQGPEAPVEVAEEVQAEEEELPPVAAEETVALPTFDIVRVDRFGSAIVAGRAAPGATVELLANGEVIATVEAGPDGSWVIDELVTPLSEGPVELALQMTAPDGLTVRGGETVIIYVPERPEDAPVVLRTTPGGSTEILQRATDDVGELGPFAIEAIDYDDAGNVIFSGRAEPLRVVQIFANRQPVGQTTSDEQGRWELSATMRPGRYTLQVIQLDENGAPRFALEVPFEQAALSDVLVRDGRVIVQPGNSLWVISRTVYGAGAQYTVIYRANADQIRDPDLIYPGQVFRLPDAEEEGGEEE